MRKVGDGQITSKGKEGGVGVGVGGVLVGGVSKWRWRIVVTEW